MIRPTTNSMIPCQWQQSYAWHADGVLQKPTQGMILVLGLTPTLRLIVLLHHQRDHIQLLLMGVVGLCATGKSV